MNLIELYAALNADKDKAEKYKAALSGDECRACGNDAEAISLAARTVGFEISPEEVERGIAEIQELDEDELKKIGAGRRGIDHDGHDSSCAIFWHCYIAALHTEGGTQFEKCLSNYKCAMVNKSDPDEYDGYP